MLGEHSTRRLAGKTALVTAAAQGIGRAVCERLLAEGAQVHASDLNGEGLATLSGAQTRVLDATDLGAVRAYFDEFDRIDVLVHAVGYVHQGTIEECGPDDWQRSVDITLTSAYNVLSAAVPKMKRHGGSIVTIGSVVSSIKGMPKRAAYGAAKGGVIGLTKSVAADYVGDGIRCNSVCPGTVQTPSLDERIDELAQKMGGRDAAYRFFIERQPGGRFGRAEEVAALCAFLASDDGAFVTGQTINIDGGMTI